MEIVIKIEAEEDFAVLHNDVQVKLERSDRERQAELVNKLYLDHEVKEEIVIGPVVLQKPSSPVLRDVTANSSVLKSVSHCGLCGQDIHSSSSKLTHHKCPHAFNISSCNIDEQGEHIATKLTCDICKKKFKWKITLIRHILHVHKYGDKRKILRLTCRICCKQFSDRSNLITHKRVHSADDKYSCKMCSKQFTNSSDLNNHQRVHSGDKPHLCNICNKQFSRSSNLFRHQSIHSGDKPYSCKICSKQFSRSSYLFEHQRIHTGHKPYSCKICTKQFSACSNLTKHHRVHTGDKPYSCKVCNKQFSDKRSSNRHESTHSIDMAIS